MQSREREASEAALLSKEMEGDGRRGTDDGDATGTVWLKLEVKEGKGRRWGRRDAASARPLAMLCCVCGLWTVEVGAARAALI
jgi:hypothetical protein